MSSNIFTFIEHFKNKTDSYIRALLHHDELLYLDVTDMNCSERAWLDKCADRMDLVLRLQSEGKREYVRLLKRENQLAMEHVSLAVSPESVKAMMEFVAKNPGDEDGEVFAPKFDGNSPENGEVNMGQLQQIVPMLPLLSVNHDLVPSRIKQLVWASRNEIMEKIVLNQVLIICGETGSGKTTQIPQFILEYSRSVCVKARIICTQPRRIAAFAAAERVSTERNERIGQTVGYHVRLESCVGPKTCLTFCTTDILLRTLMAGQNSFKNITHIIIDEIHERDRLTDLLMLALRDWLVIYPHLRLILMTASTNLEAFRKYFGNAEMIKLPGHAHEVRQLFLDDVLPMLRYESKAMKDLKMELLQEKYLESTNSEVDDLLMECVLTGSDTFFGQVLEMIIQNKVSINYQHPVSGYTLLIAAAMHGKIEVVSKLLHLGADVHLTSKTKCTAFDSAVMNNYEIIAKMLKVVTDREPSKYQITTNVVKLYEKSKKDEVDLDLILALLQEIHMTKDFHGVMIFLPGYDYIMALKEKILSSAEMKRKPFRLFLLHSRLQLKEQNQLFIRVKEKRKIILTTKIAESGITVDDLAYVIDCGKIKESWYDPDSGMSGVHLQWVSKCSASQRAGRTGRTRRGTCFHIMTREQYESLPNFPTSEILRTPLEDICLQTKLLAPSGTSILDYLSQAIDPPNPRAVRNAIDHLQEIEALDLCEELTVLGHHLVDIAVEPHFGKMLIYAVIFKCLDPILTVVTFLVYKGPFLLSELSKQNNGLSEIRKQFAAGNFSDHVVFIKMFNEWQSARFSNTEKKFCETYLINSTTMEMIVNIRSQLLAQLRANGFVKNKPPSDMKNLNEYSNNWAMVKAVLTAAYCTNIAYVNKHSIEISTREKKKVMLHNLCTLLREPFNESGTMYAQSLMKMPTNWLIYDNVSEMENNWNIQTCTNITDLTVVLFVNNTDPIQPEEMPPDFYKLKKWILFEGAADLLNLVRTVKNKMRKMLMYRISNPGRPPTTSENAILQLIGNVLATEDRLVGVIAPTGIGLRPKITMHNSYAENIELKYLEIQAGVVSKKLDRISAELLNFQPVNATTYRTYKPERALLDVRFSHFSQYCPLVQQISNMNISSDQASTSRSLPEQQNALLNRPNALPQELRLRFNNNTFPIYPVFSPTCLDGNQPTTPVSPSESYPSPIGYPPGFYFGTTGYSPVTSYSPTQFGMQFPTETYFPSRFNYNDYINMKMDGATAAAAPAYNASIETACADLQVPNDNELSTNQLDPNMHKFVFIRVTNVRTIDAAISRRTWVFTPPTDKILMKFLLNAKGIYLVFGSKNTRTFHALARFVSNLNEVSNNGTHRSIDFISRADIKSDAISDFGDFEFLDGQEIAFNVGKQLYYLFSHYTPVPLIQIAKDVPNGARIIKKSNS